VNSQKPRKRDNPNLSSIFNKSKDEAGEDEEEEEDHVTIP
jgi:hypothetical protein